MHGSVALVFAALWLELGRVGLYVNTPTYKYYSEPHVIRLCSRFQLLLVATGLFFSFVFMLHTLYPIDVLYTIFFKQCATKKYLGFSCWNLGEFGRFL